MVSVRGDACSRNWIARARSTTRPEIDGASTQANLDRAGPPPPASGRFEHSRTCWRRCVGRLPPGQSANRPVRIRREQPASREWLVTAAAASVTRAFATGSPVESATTRRTDWLIVLESQARRWWRTPQECCALHAGWTLERPLWTTASTSGARRSCRTSEARLKADATNLRRVACVRRGRPSTDR